MGSRLLPRANPSRHARVGHLLRASLKAYACYGFAAFVAKLFAGFWRRRRMAAMLRGVPNMRARLHPVFGAVPDLVANRRRAHHWRDEISRGMPIAKLMGPSWDPLFVIIGVRDPEVIRHFLKDGFEKYSKGNPRDDWPSYMLHRFLGDGIFTAMHGVGAPDGGKQWSQQRKLAASIFTRANFNNGMHDTFVTKADRLRKVLRPGHVVDMQAQAFNYTMDSIMAIFFGEDCDTIGGNPSAYGAAFDTAHRCFFEFTMTTLPVMSLARLLPWPFSGTNGLVARGLMAMSPTDRLFRKSMRILDEETAQIVERCKNDRKLEARSDVLALFMQSTLSAGMPDKVAAQYLRDAVLNFVIAGRDTTACLISWLLFIMATNSEVQARVAEEVDSCLPADTVPTLSLLHQKNMPLLHALVYETLRLHPPVPFDFKETQEDDVLPNGVRIPRNAKLWFIPWAMGRDPAVYADPEQVVLERWVPFKQPPPHEFPVFQAGPRICLGMEMAIFETKVVISMLLQWFSFRLLEGEAAKVRYSQMLTMSVCNSPAQDSHCLWLVPESRVVPARGGARRQTL